MYKENVRDGSMLVWMNGLAVNGLCQEGSVRATERCGRLGIEATEKEYSQPVLWCGVIWTRNTKIYEKLEAEKSKKD